MGNSSEGLGSSLLYSVGCSNSSFASFCCCCCSAFSNNANVKPGVCLFIPAWQSLHGAPVGDLPGREIPKGRMKYKSRKKSRLALKKRGTVCSCAVSAGSGFQSQGRGAPSAAALFDAPCPWQRHSLLFLVRCRSRCCSPTAAACWRNGWCPFSTVRRPAAL